MTLEVWYHSNDFVKVDNVYFFYNSILLGHINNHFKFSDENIDAESSYMILKDLLIISGNSGTATIQYSSHSHMWLLST